MPGVVLLGPRQIGKTTLARSIADEHGANALYLDLESDSDRRVLSDARAFLETQHGKLVVLDEVQRMPELFAVLRGVIDERRRRGQSAGSFLLLGSAHRLLLQQPSESLAGRVAYVSLGSIDALEAHAGGIASLDQLWVRGGFPASLTAPHDLESFRRRKDLIRTYLERDLPMLAPRLPVATIGRLWTMLAHAQGQPLNLSQLAASLAVTAPTVAHHVDVLSDMGLTRRLLPWFANVGKRLVKSPKTYVCDSGLLHALLGLDSLQSVLGHPIAGRSFEGMVIESVIHAMGDRRDAYFYRTANGAEIDLVLTRGGVPDVAIEVKRSSAPTVERGFHLACDDLGIGTRWLVYPGEHTYPLPNGIEVLPLSAVLRRVSAA